MSDVPAETSKTESPSQLVLPDQVLPLNLFVVPVSSAVIFPSLMAPLVVSNPRWIATVEEAISRNRTIGILLSKTDPLREDAKSEDLFDTGVVARIVKRIKLSDGAVHLLIHSLKRFKTKRVLSEQPYIVVEAEYLEDQGEKSTEMDALSRTVISQVKRLSEVNPFFTEDMKLAMINAPGPGTIADLVAFALSLPKDQAQDFLEAISVKERFEKLLLHLRREQDVADVQKKITDEVNSKLTKMQREFFLKEQLRSIKRELGYEEEGKEKSSRTFRERIQAANMPEEVHKVAMEEVEKFETISETSPEYNVSRNYLEILVSLPWSVETPDAESLKASKNILEEDHFGLDKVKERIVEFLAVRRLNPNPKSSILCLVGPPGVGKTSIGKSIARSMGRKFYRFSLGGMRDEAEIKGHRRTYIGSMPGKIIQAIRRAGAKNAVLMLDEIDKLGMSFQGDPGSALLEVLDPEQNHAFVDHYLDVPFDLSKVLFVATANTVSSIPPALLDRMEIIEIPGYTLEEKEAIARSYVIPKEIKSSGLTASMVKIDKEAIRRIMLDYAREPGMRQLQNLVAKIFRKTAREWIETQERYGSKAKSRWKTRVISPADLRTYLGPVRYYNEIAERMTSHGVVVGLAWTALGGDILFIEANDIPGGTGQVKLTGQMGDVMKESSAIAWSLMKKRASQKLGLTSEYFKTTDIHLHLPAGAVPKDGPSAGVSMATAFYSLLSGQKTRSKLAMTGELSLMGKVLPVGGIREKLLAAKRAGIEEVLLPKLNKKDVEDLPKASIEGLKIRYVSQIEDVLELALEAPEKKTLKRESKVKNRAKVLLTASHSRTS